MEFLAAAVVLLTALTMLDLALTLAVIRRMRLLQGKLRNVDATLPPVGSAVGRFQAELLDGGSVTQADLAGGDVLVGFFEPGCPACTDLIKLLRAEPPRLPMVAFVGGGVDDPEVAGLTDGLSPIARVAHVDVEGPVAKAFSVTGFPTLIRLADGVVQAAGHRLPDVMTSAAPARQPA